MRKNARRRAGTRRLPFAAALLLFLLFLSPVRANAAAIVDDEADLLSDGQEQQLLLTARQMAEENDYDYLIVTTDDAEGWEAQEYAEQYYLDNAYSDDGIVYLIDMDNREIAIATSGDLIYYVGDDDIDRMLDAAYEEVSGGRYENAFRLMLKATGQCIEGTYGQGSGYGQTSGTYGQNYGTDPSYVVAVSERDMGPIFMAALLAGIATAVITYFSISNAYRGGGRREPYAYRENSSLSLRVRRDAFINRTVTHTRIPKNRPPQQGPHGGSHGGPGTHGHPGSHSFGGGHFGPSGSTHTGAGGHTFGGGSRKF